MQGAHSPDLSGFPAVPARRRDAAGRAVRHRVRLAAVTLIVALAGCAAKAEEPVPPPPVTTAEPTVAPTTEPEPEPSPSPSGLVRPEAMAQGDDAGAIAAAEYYTLLGFESLRTSDTTEWEAVSGESCEYCSWLVDDVRTAAEVGATFSGGDIELLGPGRIIGREEILGVIGIDVPYRVAEQIKYAADGTVEHTWPTSEAYFYVEVAHGYEGWIIMGAETHPLGY